MAVVTRTTARYEKIDGTPIEKTPQLVSWDAASAAKGGYKHFMEKEIFEQPRSLTDTLTGRINLDRGTVRLEDIPFTQKEMRDFKEIVILACGTAWHAALAGKYMFEEIARIPVEVDYGSEYRYRNPVVEPGTLALAITQSGETVDTLEAMSEAQRKGARVTAIVNVVGSQADRVAESKVHVQAGPEIAVAST